MMVDANILLKNEILDNGDILFPDKNHIKNWLILKNIYIEKRVFDLFCEKVTKLFKDGQLVSLNCGNCKCRKNFKIRATILERRLLASKSKIVYCCGNCANQYGKQ